MDLLHHLWRQSGVTLCGVLQLLRLSVADRTVPNDGVEWMTALRSLTMLVSSGSAGRNFLERVSTTTGMLLPGLNMDDVRVILLQQLKEHALKSWWGPGKWLPGDDFQWFMLGLDGDFLAVDVLMEALAAEHDRIEFFFNLGVILFCLVEGLWCKGHGFAVLKYGCSKPMLACIDLEGDGLGWVE